MSFTDPRAKLSLEVVVDQCSCSRCGKVVAPGTAVCFYAPHDASPPPASSWCLECTMAHVRALESLATGLLGIGIRSRDIASAVAAIANATAAPVKVSARRLRVKA